MAEDRQQATRFDRGLRRLNELDGDIARTIQAGLADISPDLARYAIEFSFGDVYSRPGLSLAEREIATIAALTAMGTAAPQLKIHIKAGLNVGLTRTQITETILQMLLYAGFPAALNAMAVAREVFRETNEAGTKDAPA